MNEFDKAVSIIGNNTDEQYFDLKNITRFEVIDYTSPDDVANRKVIFDREDKEVSVAFQDEGRTLKVFVNNKPAVDILDLSAIKVPDIEIDRDQYPNDVSVSNFVNHLNSINSGFIGKDVMKSVILGPVQRALDEMGYGKVQVIDNGDTGVYSVAIITEGWSGVEEVVTALLSVVGVKTLYYSAWKNSGYHEFSWSI